MATTEAKFSVSYAPGKPAMITIRGDSAEEAKAAHEAAVESGLLQVIKQVQDSLNGAARAAAAGPAVQVPSPSGQGSVTVQDGKVQQPAQQLPPGMAEPPCTECGQPTKFAQEGISAKSGQHYRRYSCTATPTHKSTFTN
jgi:hypothetical protein